MSESTELIYTAMRELGVKNQRDRMREQMDHNNASATPPGAKLVSESAGAIVRAIKAHRADYNKAKANTHLSRLFQLVDEFGLERAAGFASVFLVNHLAEVELSRTSLGKVRSTLAAQILKEREFMAVDEHLPHMMRWNEHFLETGGAKSASILLGRLWKRLDEDRKPGWDKKDALLLSSHLLKAAEIEAGLVESYPSKAKNKKHPTPHLRLAESVREWLTDALSTVEQLVPARLPVPHRPVDWSAEGGGGYLPGMAPQLPFVTGRGGHMRRLEEMRHYPAVVDAVNIIQSTPWSLNAPVLEAVRYAVSQGWNDVGLPSSPGEPPTPPDTPFDAKDRGWRYFLGRKRRHGEQRHAEFLGRARLARMLSTARLLERIEEGRFYFVHQLDWRGRCYAVGANLNPQGPDYQRASLTFAEGKELGAEGFRHLLYQAANTYGNGIDKLSIEERCRWGDANIKRIRMVGADFRDDSEFWRDADEPFQFLAACIEIHRALENPGGVHSYVSHLPVAFDGSANGLQCLSLAMRDPVGAKATNCSPTPEPSDIYAAVSGAFSELVEEGATGEGDKAKWCRQFSAFVKKYVSKDGVVPRGWSKKTTMCVPYSATLYTIQEDLSDKYHSIVRDLDLPEGQRPFPDKDTYAALVEMAKLMRLAVGRVVVRAFEVMDWLQKVSRVANENSVHLEWTTVMGFPVRQNYLKALEKEFRYKTLGGKTAKVKVLEDNLKEIHKRRSVNGIVPNFTHSCDGAAMQLSALYCNDSGADSLSMIHDSFATHAGDAEILSASLRLAYRDVFSQDVFGAFEANVRRLLPEDVELPKRPEQGDFDLNDLLAAEFFFS